MTYSENVRTPAQNALQDWTDWGFYSGLMLRHPLVFTLVATSSVRSSTGLQTCALTYGVRTRDRRVAWPSGFRPDNRTFLLRMYRLMCKIILTLTVRTWHRVFSVFWSGSQKDTWGQSGTLQSRSKSRQYSQDWQSLHHTPCSRQLRLR